MKKFIKEENGDAFVWAVVIIGIGVFGLIYVIFDPIMDAVLQVGVDSDIPSQQQNIEQKTWDIFLPMGVFIAWIIWGFTQNQRRRVIG